MEEGVSSRPRLSAGLALALAVAALVSLVAPEPGVAASHVAAPRATGLRVRPRASQAVVMAMVR